MKKPFAPSLADCGGDSEGFKETTMEFDSPIVILDDNTATVTATAKFERNVTQYGHIIGYDIILKNKSGKYMTPIIWGRTIGSTALGKSDQLACKAMLIAPNTTRETFLFFQPKYCETIKHLEDLHDFFGFWQIWLSDDGFNYDSNDMIVTRFLNVLP